MRSCTTPGRAGLTCGPGHARLGAWHPWRRLADLFGSEGGGGQPDDRGLDRADQPLEVPPSVADSDGRGDKGLPCCRAGDQGVVVAIVYAGRVIPEKGVPTLVRSLAHMPEATVAVDGPVSSQERDRLSALASELGVTHQLHMTRSTRAELPGRYRAADVVVFPSEWEEPFGIVPLEAMACGVPVVATGTGGSGEFLHDGVNCLLFRAGDAAGLAGAVTRLAADPALRSRIVAGGTQTALEMNMDTYADRLEDLHRAPPWAWAAG